MDNLYGDERISSYLDGELSADEQALFEERLAESAELRQLVEELRALRGSLDLLPRYQLEPDFAERVLRRAEQQMLIGGDGGSSGGALRASASGESNAPPQTQPASAELAQPSHAVLDESRRWQGRIVRPLVYAGAAIAAAILIMVFTPPGGNEVAQNRSAENPVQRGDGPVSSTSKDERALSGLAVERSKTPAQKNPASPQVANQSKSGLADGGQSDQGRHYSNANDLAKANEILRRHGYGTAQANLLVASYEVSPDTSNSAFLELLAKHRIAMGPATDGAPPVSSQPMDQVSREAGARSEAWLEQVRPIPDDKTAANGRPSQTPQLGAIQAAEEPRRDLEIVYVEGSLEQITELVSDLDASKTEFRSLAVDRTPVKKLQMLRKPDNAATPTDAMGDVHARGEAVPESKPMGLAIDDRVPREEKNGPSIAKSEAGKELHGLREGQAEAKDAASQPGNKAQSADKSAPADSNAPAMPSAPETPPAFSALRTTVRAPGAAPPTAAQAAPDSAKSPAGRENRDGDKLMSEERSLELGMNPSRPKQADRGKGEEGEPFGYAFWLYPLPTEAKQELKKEQLDRFKFQKQQVEDASPASTALGSVAAAKSPPPTPSAPPSASAAAPTARPVLAEPTQPSPIQSAPTNKATTRPEDPSAPKSAKAPAAEGRAGGRPEADKPAVEKPPETGGVNAKLRDESKDFQAPPAAMPPSPPTPQDFERSFNRKAPRAGAQVVAKDDAKAGGAAAPSPRIQAILIFRIDPPPTSAAPPPAAGPASDVKAKQ